VSDGPLWVGIDDTDSPDGGCTTYTLTEVLVAAHEQGLDLIGEPRLVRLNPNVPFKTRGNGALAARFGHGRGGRRRQGTGPTGPVWAFARGRAPSPTETTRLLEAAWDRILRAVPRGTPGTDPALVASRRPIPAALYRTAVGRLVGLPEVERLLAERGCQVRTEGSRQGIVGAAAAIAWPGRRATWELIGYRAPPRWGSPRRIEGGSITALQRRFPALFLCHDARTRRLLVAPHTACPVLFGLRSRDRTVLARALAGVGSEPVDRWLVFRTNQGTGDHRVRRGVADLRPFDSAWVRGTVTGPPERLPGGHVRWTIGGVDGARLLCVAFEPTKTLPSVAADLATGDRVELWGGRRADPTFRVEGLRLLARARRRGPARAPRCTSCGRRTRSLGRGRGYRCDACRTRLPPERAEWPARPGFPLGTYHPTPSARRHLAPLGPEALGPPGADGGVGIDLYRP
jgi:tRNA(Ile2)-agmatinylcytidine synthase